LTIIGAARQERFRQSLTKRLKTASKFYELKKTRFLKCGVEYQVVVRHKSIKSLTRSERRHPDGKRLKDAHRRRLPASRRLLAQSCRQDDGVPNAH
jgi:hypothetical protein